MGYGSRALQLLQMYYEGRFPCLEEKVFETPQEIHTVSSEVSLFWQSSSPGSERMILWALTRLDSQPRSPLVECLSLVTSIICHSGNWE